MVVRTKLLIVLMVEDEMHAGCRWSGNNVVLLVVVGVLMGTLK